MPGNTSAKNKTALNSNIREFHVESAWERYSLREMLLKEYFEPICWFWLSSSGTIDVAILGQEVEELRMIWRSQVLPKKVLFVFYGTTLVLHVSLGD